MTNLFNLLFDRCLEARTNKERCELINRISKAYTEGHISQNENDILIDVLKLNAEGKL